MEERERTPTPPGRRAPRSARELRERCESYFEQCIAEEKRWTLPGLILALELSEKQFGEIMAGRRGEKMAQALGRAVLRIRDDLEQRSDGMSVLRLRQVFQSGCGDRAGGEKRGEEAPQVRVTFGGAAEDQEIYGK